MQTPFFLTDRDTVDDLQPNHALRKDCNQTARDENGAQAIQEPDVVGGWEPSGESGGARLDGRGNLQRERCHRDGTLNGANESAAVASQTVRLIYGR